MICESQQFVEPLFEPCRYDHSQIITDRFSMARLYERAQTPSEMPWTSPLAAARCQKLRELSL
jgi:hypothetical protein